MKFEFIYHKKLEHLHVGTEEPRAYFIPYESERKALAGERSESAAFKTLCGDWLFRFYPSEYALDDFLSPAFSAGDFDRLTVPGNWQMAMGQGYDVPVYMNTDSPIPFDPPHIPTETPCGLYVRDFTIQKKPDREYYLNFEGVDPCLYVFLNDRFVGYSQVSHCTSEFRVTDFLRDGENTIKRSTPLIRHQGL